MASLPMQKERSAFVPDRPQRSRESSAAMAATEPFERLEELLLVMSSLSASPALALPIIRRNLYPKPFGDCTNASPRAHSMSFFSAQSFVDEHIERSASRWCSELHVLRRFGRWKSAVSSGQASSEYIGRCGGQTRPYGRARAALGGAPERREEAK